MAHRTYVWVATLALVSVVAIACRTSTHSPRTARERPANRAASDSPDEIELPKDAEKRVEAHARYALGIIHELNEESDAAIEAFTKSVELDPANEPLVVDLSRKLIQLKQYAKAEELLARATARPNASPALFARLGLVYSLLGKNEQAIAANQAALKKSPRLVAAYQNLFQLHFQAKQYDQALKILERAAGQPNPDANYLIDVAELYSRYGRGSPERTQLAKERASALLDRAAQLPATDSAAQQRLAEACARLGELPKAIAIYLKVLEQTADPMSVRERLISLYLRANDKAGVTQQLEAIAREYPSAQAFYSLGSIAQDQRSYKEATEYFRKALEYNPDFEPVYYELAGALINADQARDGLATLDRARAKFSRNFLTEFYAGMAFTKLKEYTNAVSGFAAAEKIAQASETNRLNHVFYFQFGAACERAHQFTEAEQHFKKALAQKPDFGEALNYLGYMWADRGEHLAEAREMIEKAVKLEPDNGAFIDSLGWVLFRLNQPKEALTHVLRAIDLTQEPDATLYDHLGDIYAALQQPDKAREAWQKSLAIEPNDAIRKKLEPARPAQATPR